MFLLAATTSRFEPGNYAETMAELDEPKSKSENALACARSQGFDPDTQGASLLRIFLRRRRRSRGKWLGVRAISATGC
jgi:hypothetical protein